MILSHYVYCCNQYSHYSRAISLPRSGSLSRRKILSMFRLISLGISTNLEAVTAQYVDVRLERKQSVLQTYHKALQPKTTVTGKEAGQETSKKAKKKSSEMEL